MAPSEMAGVAMQTSHMRLVANTLNSTPGFTTNTLPCSLVK